MHNKQHTAWTRPFTSHIKGYKQPHMLIYCHASHHFIDAYGANTWHYRPWRYNSYWARRASWEFILIWVQKSLQNWINCAHVKGGSDHKGSLLHRISSRFEKHSRKNVARSNQRYRTFCPRGSFLLWLCSKFTKSTWRGDACYLLKRHYGRQIYVHKM